MKRHRRQHIILINLLVAVALTMIVNFSYFISGNEVRPSHRPPPPESFISYYIAFQCLYFFVMTLIVVSINTIRRFSLGRKILLTLVVVLLLYLFIPIPTRGGEWHVPLVIGRLYNPLHIMKCSFILIVSILYGLIFELIYQKQHITIENEQLKNENLQTRYNMLANQISPHFLFNSLNSLSMLVREKSNDKALLYIDRMADTFRYMLQSGQGELTTLKEELRFTEAYLYLLLIRYENKLFCDIQVDEQHKSWKLPVLSLQPLIENAVKHNSITFTKPFRITIRTENDTLIVSNPLIPKIDPQEGTQIGLKNLSSRYQLLTQHEVEIIRTEHEFRVILPLVKH